MLDPGANKNSVFTLKKAFNAVKSLKEWYEGERPVQNFYGTQWKRSTKIGVVGLREVKSKGLHRRIREMGNDPSGKVEVTPQELVRWGVSLSGRTPYIMVRLYNEVQYPFVPVKMGTVKRPDNTMQKTYEFLYASPDVKKEFLAPDGLIAYRGK